MKIILIEGSCRGQESSSLYFARRLMSTADKSLRFEILEVGKYIKVLAENRDFFDSYLKAMQESDAVIWLVPVRNLLPCYEICHFLSLIDSRNAGERLENKYTTALFTSSFFSHREAEEYTTVVPAGANEVALPNYTPGIYELQMNDGRYLLFYLSPSTTRSGLEKLSLALVAAVSSRAARASYRPRSRVLPPVPRTYSYLYALKSPCEWVPLSESEGRMCAQNAGVSPPCFPVVIAGEIIGGRAIEILGSAEHTFGLSQGRIKVVKMR